MLRTIDAIRPFLALPKRRRARWRARVAALRAEIQARGLDAERALALAEALEGARELLAAVDALSDANRLRPDVALERRLVRLRRNAFAELARARAPGAWPPGDLGEGPVATGPLVAKSDELTPRTLARGILRHGCLLVRGLVPPARVARLRDAIDRAFDACDATLARRATPSTAAWYDPVERVPKNASRTWVRAGQGVLAADSPRAFFELMETVRELGLDRLIAGYFGERPALSIEKTVLRRADARLHESAWHQDGAFLGRGIRTVDTWVALSSCGRDAPGLELMPVRLERLLATGQDGTYFEWTVSPETIARELPGLRPWRPEFEEGDALFFDHFLLHRTAAERDMPGVRYAIESWFFAPSVYPKASTPLAV
jgi:hypothetical protein